MEQMAHVLVLEDDVRVQRFLLEALKSEGYQVSHCSNISQLNDVIASRVENYDLAIFDRMLGAHDSLSRLGDFKRAFPQCKVLMLSAIHHSEQKALALDQGADDYMSKPYSLVELSARLRVLARHATQVTPAPTVKQLGNLTLDLVSHEVHVETKRLDLANKEYKVLSCLAQRPGQVLSKYQLLDRVWDIQRDLESNVVENAILNLRKKLDAAGASLKLCSKRNVGYWVET